MLLAELLRVDDRLLLAELCLWNVPMSTTHWVVPTSNVHESSRLDRKRRSSLLSWLVHCRDHPKDKNLQLNCLFYQTSFAQSINYLTSAHTHFQFNLNWFGFCNIETKSERDLSAGRSLTESIWLIEFERLKLNGWGWTLEVKLQQFKRWAVRW